jgi:hypothetical protein
MGLKAVIHSCRKRAVVEIALSRYDFVYLASLRQRTACY